MIPTPSGVRVWLAVGHTDMRRGMHSLALQVQLDLMTRANSGFVRQKASADILDRGGLRPPDRHQHIVDGAINISIDLGPD